jgi:hypothetical protein
MPSSLVVVAIVLAWLVVLVPMIVRKRQEVAKTADSELAARVLRSGSGEAEADTREDAEYGMEEVPMRDTDEVDEDFGGELAAPAEHADDESSEDAAHEPERDEMSAGYYDEADPYHDRRYRPGRGGFDPEAAAIIAKAKYGFRQRVVLAMLIGAVATAVAGAVVLPMAWWAHGAIDLVLVSYLVYLRRQVRIETEIRERRLARMNRVRQARAQAVARRRAEEPAYAEPEPELAELYEDPEEVEAFEEEYEPEEAVGPRERVSDGPYTAPVVRAGAVVVDVDDEDPAFVELDEPGSLPYRRAVGE